MEKHIQRYTNRIYEDLKNVDSILNEIVKSQKGKPKE
jgi:hypothetical protein